MMATSLAFCALLSRRLRRGARIRFFAGIVLAPILRGCSIPASPGARRFAFNLKGAALVCRAVRGLRTFVRRTRRIKCSIEAVEVAVKGKVSFDLTVRSVSVREQASDARRCLYDARSRLYKRRTGPRRSLSRRRAAGVGRVPVGRPEEKIASWSGGQVLVPSTETIRAGSPGAGRGTWQPRERRASGSSNSRFHLRMVPQVRAVRRAAAGRERRISSGRKR